ncbi:MAG: polymer-forming cytoskeletal protein [Oceanicaulis sp.]|nr:polymer-forming cytoskeletal protein [Oceanicaulis sp.]
MFNKKDAPAPDAASPPPPAKRSAMKSNKAPSILSADLTIVGSISSEGEVQLDGNVEGDVRAGSLTIGEEASVKGEVIAESIVVRGRIEGSLRARQVQLASTARIEGDIVHSTLAVESGAFFDGHCRRSSDPISDKPATGSGGSASGASADKPKVASVPPAAPPSSSSAASTGARPAAAANADPFASSKA